MGLRSYLNKKLSAESTPEEGARILGALRKVYSSPTAQRAGPLLRERAQQILEALNGVERVKVYRWRLNPPAHISGAMDGCFGNSRFDFRYDQQTRTLEVGGDLGELYFLAEH